MLRGREVWAYAAGDFGFNTVWQSVELYLLFYYVRQLGITPEVASLIFLAGAAADWLMDVFVGVTADRLAPRVRLGAWVSIGGPLSVLILCAAFAPPPVRDGYVPYYALVTYLLLRCAYGFGNIPYGALTARISADPADHLRLTSARMQAAALGGLVAALVYAMLPAGGRSGGDFSLGAGILAAIALPTFFVTTFGTRERAVPAVVAKRADRSLIATVRLLARSSALRRLMATIVTVGLVVSLLNVSLLFVFDRLGAQRWGYYAALLPALSLLVTAPLWTNLARRTGQGATLRYAAVLMFGAALLGCVGGVATALLSVTGAIVAGQGMSVMFWSLVPAAVTACERDAEIVGYAARIYAAATIARKLAQALSTQVLALTLLVPALPILASVAASALLAALCAIFYCPVQDPRVPLAS